MIEGVKRLQYYVHALVVLGMFFVNLAVAEGQERPGIPADEVLSGAPLAASSTDVRLMSDDEIRALSPEMLTFLEQWVDTRSRDYFKLQQLIYAIINSGSFELTYDEVTRTAAETFALQQGNCLSFSNMFVAMARQVGIEVHYQEVDIPPDWSMREDLFVLNRHVNVLVDLGQLGEHVVDFNIDDFKTAYDRQAISDSRALAHHYNNLGVERMQADDDVTAVAYFRKAIVENDRRFSPAWTNLGSLYLREGHSEYAEAAFLHALDADNKDYVAMSNLLRLYDAIGDSEKAASLRRRVDHHRMRNPYFRYREARQAFFLKDYDTAISHLKYATRKKKTEDQFAFLLGLCFLMKGDEAQASRWMNRAEEIASNAALKRNYSSKIDALLSSAQKIQED